MYFSWKKSAKLQTSHSILKFQTLHSCGETRDKNDKMKKLLILLLILMTLLTALSLNDFLSVIFISNVKDSGDYLYNISPVNIYFSLASLILLYFIVIRYKISKKNILPIVLLFAVWLLSGRRVSERMDLTCEISTGLYIIPGKHYYPCSLPDEYHAYSDDEVSQVRVKKSGLWYIEITNKDIKHKVFIGPFTYGNVLKTLRRLSPDYRPKTR